MRSPDTVFFGQPKGLGFLASTQAWERFSFYGMQALLPLYLAGHLLDADVASGVWGLAGLRAGIESLTGPLTNTAFAAQLFGLYIGLFNIAPLLGGWLADVAWGQRRTVMAGLVLMAAGHLAMAVEVLLLPALGLLLAGGGCLKGNLYAQVGMLYAAGDTRRTRAYAIHLMALNVGSVLAPLVCGTLGEEVGWHWGFGAAGVGMLAGLAIYVAGSRHLPPDQSRQRAVVAASTGDLPAIIAIGLMLMPYMIVYAAAMQAYNLLLVWAETAMNRDVAGFSVPVTWLLTVDGLLTILGIGLALRLWAWLGPREPGTLAKLGVAGVLVAAAWVILALVTPDAGGGQVPFLAVLGFFFVIDLSYGWLDPPSNAFVSAHAPARLATTLMSLNIAAFGAANILSGWFGRFYEPLGPAGFWWLMAAVALAGTVVALVLRPIVARLMRA